MEHDAPKNRTGYVPDNVGQVGIESIRVGGMTIDQLPMAEGAITKQQWPEIEKSNKQQLIDNIKSRYPKGTIRYYQSRIEECNGNIQRVRTLVDDQNRMINEYVAHISICKFRDKEIDKVNARSISNRAKKEQVAELKKQFPMYNVEAMNEQIDMCKEAIERSNDVITSEMASIKELMEAIAKCKQRDAELKPYGAEIG